MRPTAGSLISGNRRRSTKRNAGQFPRGEAWHGFQDADDDHMFLDPVKVTILTPGMDEQGNMAEEGSRPRWWPNSSTSAA